MTQNVRDIAQPFLRNGQTLPVEVNKNMIEGSYLNRMDQPEDIGKAIIFFASEDANFITGQFLWVDKPVAFIAFTRRPNKRQLWRDSKFAPNLLLTEFLKRCTKNVEKIQD